MLPFRTGIPHNHEGPQLDKVDHRVITLLSLMLMLAVNFTLTYLVHTYYRNSFYDMSQAGFWLILGNSFILFSLFLLCKRAVGWKWKHTGLGKPSSWWLPVITAIFLITAIVVIVKYLQPIVFSITSTPDVSHLYVFQDNLPLLLTSLIYVWFHGAFLQELIFRAFFINTVDILLGRDSKSLIIAIITSSLAFGLIHAWQGWGGIILTTLMGFIFGIAYIFNRRRIWPLIVVHGLMDTLTLISLYQM